MPPRDPPSGGLSAAALAGLLARLGPDPEQAGAAYEDVRRALVAFFTWRGAFTPEECADETLDRVARRIEEGEDVRDVPRFARGVARLVLLEHWRKPDTRRAELSEQPEPVAEPAAPDDEALHRCLDRCLGELPDEGRRLIMDYYQEAGRARIERRQAMARSLGLSEAALRNRAQRLRNRLEDCLAGCMAADAREPDTNVQ